MRRHCNGPFQLLCRTENLVSSSSFCLSILRIHKMERNSGNRTLVLLALRSCTLQRAAIGAVDCNCCDWWTKPKTLKNDGSLFIHINKYVIFLIYIWINISRSLTSAYFSIWPLTAWVTRSGTQRGHGTQLLTSPTVTVTPVACWIGVKKAGVRVSVRKQVCQQIPHWLPPGTWGLG